MTELQIKPEDIRSAIERNVANFNPKTSKDEVGRVAETGDGIARVEGLPSAMTSELLEFEGGLLGVALNLDVSEIGAVLLGDPSGIQEGQEVRRTGRVLEVPVGDAFLGRTVDPLGNPIDGLGAIKASASGGNSQGMLGPQRILFAAFLGGVIGYLSGLLGIGGGILLSPILLLLGWTQQKQTAALGAAFIFVNSTSGLFGSIQQHPIWESSVTMASITNNAASLDGYWIVVLMAVGTLLLPVIVGGALGSWYGAKKFNQQTMKYILSVVLLIAAIKLLL